MLNLLRDRLRPFKHRNYRAFFFVQSFSLIGQWSHDLARAWIVLDLMGSATSLGSLMLASATPSLFLMLIGGTIGDRVDVRRMQMITKSILAVSALALAFLVEFGSIEMWMLLVFAFIEGVVISFDAPLYPLVLVRLVPREDFQQALSINSTNFHGARMLGPVVAALLMSWHGPSLVFLFDGVTYIGLILLLRTIHFNEIKETNTVKLNSLQSLREGAIYFFNHPKLRYRLVQLMLTISLMLPLLIVIYRTFVRQKFGLSSEEFGYVFTFPALGSMAGAITIAALKPKQPIRMLSYGIPLLAMASVMVPRADTLLMTVVYMTLGGYFAYLAFSSLTLSLHLDVEEKYRGRLGSIISLGFFSIGPLMGLPIGAFADRVGFEFSVTFLTGLFTLLSAILAYFYWRGRS